MYRGIKKIGLKFVFIMLALISFSCCSSKIEKVGENITTLPNINDTERQEKAQQTAVIKESDSISGKKDFPKGLYSLMAADRIDRAFKLEGRRSWQNPDIVGINLRTQWNRIETEEGKYDFSHFDEGVALAKKHNKKVSLSIAVGESAPDWYREKGGKFFEAEWSAGQNFLLVLPWDKLFLEKWEAVVREFGKRYDSDASVSYVHMGGLGRNIEAFYANSPEATEKFKAIGGFEKYLEAAKKIIDIYANAFPNTPICFSLGSPWRGYEVEKAVAEIIEYAITTYPKKFCTSSHALNGESKRTYYINALLYNYADYAPVGFQMVWSTLDQKRFRGTLMDAMQRGLELMTNFIELYEVDVDNPFHQKDLKEMNEILLKKEIKVLPFNKSTFDMKLTEEGNSVK